MTVDKMAVLVSMIMYNPVKGKYMDIFMKESDDTEIFLIDGGADFVKNLRKTKIYEEFMIL